MYSVGLPNRGAGVVVDLALGYLITPEAQLLSPWVIRLGYVEAMKYQEVRKGIREILSHETSSYNS